MQNMVEPREAHLRLELCADSPNHPRSSRLCVKCGDIEQRRLADTSVAGHQQRPTSDSRLIHEPADELDVRVPPDELSGRTTAHGRLPSSQPPSGLPTRQYVARAPALRRAGPVDRTRVCQRNRLPLRPRNHTVSAAADGQDRSWRICSVRSRCRTRASGTTAWDEAELVIEVPASSCAPPSLQAMAGAAPGRLRALPHDRQWGAPRFRVG